MLYRPDLLFHQQYLMSQGSPPRMKIAGLFLGEYQLLFFLSANGTCRWLFAAKAFTMPIHRRRFTTAVINTHVDLRPEAKAPLG